MSFPFLRVGGDRLASLIRVFCMRDLFVGMIFPSDPQGAQRTGAGMARALIGFCGGLARAWRGLPLSPQGLVIAIEKLSNDPQGLVIAIGKTF